MHKELEFLTLFQVKPSSVLKNSEVYFTEYALYRAYDLLKREVYEALMQGENKTRMFGRIDVIFRYKGTNYGAEVKFDEANNFWHGLKIIGYCEYFNWQMDIIPCKIRPIKPAIIMPIEKIKLEHKIVAGKTKVALFALTREKGNYKLIPQNLD